MADDADNSGLLQLPDGAAQQLLKHLTSVARANVFGSCRALRDQTLRCADGIGLHNAGSSEVALERLCNSVEDHCGPLSLRLSFAYTCKIISYKTVERLLVRAAKKGSKPWVAVKELVLTQAQLTPSHGILLPSALPNLTSLHLHSCPLITTAFLHSLSLVPNLQTLVLDRSSLWEEGAGAEQLQGLPQSRVLHAPAAAPAAAAADGDALSAAAGAGSGGSSTTGDGACDGGAAGDSPCHLIAALTALTSLTLTSPSWLYRHNVNNLRALTRLAPTLTHLSFCHESCWASDALLPTVTCLTGLLSLSFNVGHTTNMISAISRSLTALTHLDLPETTVGDEDLDSLLTRTTRLKRLVVRDFSPLRESRSHAPCSWLHLELASSRLEPDTLARIPLHSLTEPLRIRARLLHLSMWQGEQGQAGEEGDEAAPASAQEQLATLLEDNLACCTPGIWWCAPSEPEEARWWRNETLHRGMAVQGFNKEHRAAGLRVLQTLGAATAVGCDGPLPHLQLQEMRPTDMEALASQVPGTRSLLYSQERSFHMGTVEVGYHPGLECEVTDSHTQIITGVCDTSSGDSMGAAHRGDRGCGSGGGGAAAGTSEAAAAGVAAEQGERNGSRGHASSATSSAAATAAAAHGMGHLRFALSAVCKLRSLTSLELGHAYADEWCVMSAAIPHPSLSHTLRHLTLRRCEVWNHAKTSAYILSTICCLTGLTHLHLDPQVTWAEGDWARRGHGHTFPRLGGPDETTAPAVHDLHNLGAITTALTGLTSLSLPGHTMTQGGLDATLSHLTRLSRLCVHSFSGLTASRAGAACSWRQLVIAGEGRVDVATLAALPLHALTSPLVMCSRHWALGDGSAAQPQALAMQPHAAKIDWEAAGGQVLHSAGTRPGANAPHPTTTRSSYQASVGAGSSGSSSTASLRLALDALEQNLSALKYGCTLYCRDQRNTAATHEVSLPVTATTCDAAQLLQLLASCGLIGSNLTLHVSHISSVELQAVTAGLSQWSERSQTGVPVHVTRLAVTGCDKFAPDFWSQLCSALPQLSQLVVTDLHGAVELSAVEQCLTSAPRALSIAGHLHQCNPRQLARLKERLSEHSRSAPASKRASLYGLVAGAQHKMSAKAPAQAARSYNSPPSWVNNLWCAIS